MDRPERILKRDSAPPGTLGPQWVEPATDRPMPGGGGAARPYGTSALTKKYLSIM